MMSRRWYRRLADAAEVELLGRRDGGGGGEQRRGEKELLHSTSNVLMTNSLACPCCGSGAIVEVLAQVQEAARALDLMHRHGAQKGEDVLGGFPPTLPAAAAPS